MTDNFSSTGFDNSTDVYNNPTEDTDLADNFNSTDFGNLTSVYNNISEGAGLNLDVNSTDYGSNSTNSRVIAENAIDENTTSTPMELNGSVPPADAVGSLIRKYR